MGNRDHKRYMSHSLTPYFLFSNLDSAAVAYYSLVSYPFVFSAVAFVILDRSEDPFAEESVTLGFVGPVVDCLRFQHLAA